MDTQTVVNFGLVLLFVLIGGVFAATEIALVSLRGGQISALERASARGARVARVARDPNRFLAAVQIGVTVAGFLSAAYGAATLAPDITPHLTSLGLGEAAARDTAVLGLTLFIAYLSLVLGELVPKRLAMQRAVAVSVAVAPVLDRFATLMRPVIWLLSATTDVLVRLMGGDPAATGEQISEEELRELVTTHQTLDVEERRILSDVFAATEITLKEVMRPRGDVTFMPGHLRLGEAAAAVRALPYSRYPVTGDGFDEVLGFLHVRDLLGVPDDDRRRVSEICRPPLLLPASKRLLPSIATMRQDGVHLAVVVDEYGGTDGIVTLEDLVEELIGDIRDEYDVADVHETHEYQGGALSVVGVTSLADFAEETGIELESGVYETVAGYVIAQLGRIPDIGDSVDVGDSVLQVANMTGRRITELTLRPRQDSPRRSSEGS